MKLADTFISRADAWHHTGTITGQYQRWEDIADAGLGFRVFKSQLHDGLGRPIDAWGTFRWDYKAALAQDKQAAKFLGTVGKDYEVIQHREGFRMVDQLVQSADNAHYETAGTFDGGAIVWGLADLGLSINIGDDKTVAYLAFMTSYNGRLKHIYKMTNTRIVCQNTFNAALREKTVNQFAIKHTKGGAQKLIDAHAALTDISVDVKTVEEKLRFLNTRRMTRESAISLFDRLFPKREKKVESGETVTASNTRRDNILAAIMETYDYNDNNVFPEQRGTMYNMFNAITNYTDHKRGENADKRAESAIMGTGAELKERALVELVTLGQNSPSMAVQTKVYMPSEPVPEDDPAAKLFSLIS